MTFLLLLFSPSSFSSADSTQKQKQSASNTQCIYIFSTQPFPSWSIWSPWLLWLMNGSTVSRVSPVRSDKFRICTDYFGLVADQGSRRYSPQSQQQHVNHFIWGERWNRCQPQATSVIALPPLWPPNYPGWHFGSTTQTNIFARHVLMGWNLASNWCSSRSCSQGFCVVSFVRSRLVFVGPRLVQQERNPLLASAPRASNTITLQPVLSPPCTLCSSFKGQMRKRTTTRRKFLKKWRVLKPNDYRNQDSLVC